MYGAPIFSQGGNPALMGNPYAAMSNTDWEQFAKAVAVTSTNTDTVTKTGPAALQRESLDQTLRKVTESNEDFKLFRALNRVPVKQVVHTWEFMDKIGGQVAGVFNSEIAPVSQSNGSYRRYSVTIKFLMRMKAISVILNATETIPNYKAQENTNALLELARGANYTSYVGDERVAPMSFNGARRWLELYKPSQIENLDGDTSVENLAKGIFRAMAVVKGQGNFGNITHAHIDMQVQNSLDSYLFPQYRVGLDNQPASLQYGAPVAGIKTSYGTIKTEQDVFIDNSTTATMRIVADGSVPSDAPLAPTIAVAAQTAQTGSKFTSARAGLFFLKVCPINTNFVEGTPSAAASGTVVAGGSLQVTITPNGDGQATGYGVYAAPRNFGSTPTNADYRLVTRVPAANPNDLVGTPTVYNWLAEKIPGASDIYLFNRVPKAMGYAQLMPAQQLPLYATNSAIIPWMVLMALGFALWIPNHHYILSGFISPDQTWKPW